MNAGHHILCGARRGKGLKMCLWETFTMLLKSTGQYPCQWDDLIDKNSRIVVTIYTLREKLIDGPAVPGVKLCEDGIFDIVVDVPELTEKVVVEALAELSSRAGKRYRLKSA